MTAKKGQWSKRRAEELLSQGYWFGELPRSVKQSIMDRCEIRQFRRNTAIYRIGDTVDGLYAALQGDIRAHIYGDGDERILLRLMGPTSWFGEFHLIDGYPTRTFEIWAASECAVLFLAKDGYHEIAEQSLENYKHFVKLSCIHQRFLVRIAVEARSDVPRKMARALIRIAKMHGRNVDGGVHLSINVSQSELASLIGVSRQYLNELIAGWNEDGLLIWKGNAPPILYIEKLKNLLTPLDDWMLESEGWA